MPNALSRFYTSKFLSICLFGVFFATMINAQEVQSQQKLIRLVETMAPAQQIFIKDQPFLGWRLTSADINELPTVIANNLGSVDNTGYDQAFLTGNLGTVVALQMTGDGPDFYIIGLNTFNNDYSEIPLSEVVEKNPRLIERLAMVPELETLYQKGAPGLVAVLKTVPVSMIAMSDIGYDTGDEVTIQAPWGMQTKPAGKDAFLVFDTKAEQYYMVNVGESGLPLNYIHAN